MCTVNETSAYTSTGDTNASTSATQPVANAIGRRAGNERPSLRARTQPAR